MHCAKLICEQKDIPSAELNMGPSEQTFYEADAFPLS